MRRSHLIVFMSFMAILVAPHFSYAAITGLNTAIFPTSCNCVGSAPDFGCVLQVIQNIENAAVALSTVIISAFIARAGFMFISSPNSEEAKLKARASLTNAIIGLLIVLAAYLLIDSLLKVIYNQTASGPGVAQLGPWNSLLSAQAGTLDCLKLQTSPLTQVLGSITANSAAGGSASTAALSTGTGACSGATVQQDAAAGGYQISTAEANTLACLAKPEASCSLSPPVSHSSTGKASSAAGPFQILIGAKDPCHSLDIPACGNLNCSAAYSGGSPKSDPASQALAQQCQAEASNLTCSSAAAACIVQESGGQYTAWTGTGDGYTHSAQSQCVSANAGT